MSHARQQIREALVTALMGLPSTGSHVYASRVVPLLDGELPCLLVNTDDESLVVESFTQNPLLARSLTISITAIRKASSDLDGYLDTTILEVEQALNATTEANTLGGLVKYIALENIKISYDENMEQPIGQAVLTFNATYYTQAASPSVSI